MSETPKRLYAQYRIRPISCITTLLVSYSKPGFPTRNHQPNKVSGNFSILQVRKTAAPRYPVKDGRYVLNTYSSQSLVGARLCCAGNSMVDGRQNANVAMAAAKACERQTSQISRIERPCVIVCPTARRENYNEAIPKRVAERKRERERGYPL